MVDGKYINKGSHTVNAYRLFYELRVRIDYLCEKVVIILGIMHRQYLKVAFIRIYNVNEALVISSVHQYIHIVVPGNEALMSNGSEESTAVDIVYDAVLLADIIDITQYFKNSLLYLIAG